MEIKEILEINSKLESCLQNFDQYSEDETFQLVSEAEKVIENGLKDFGDNVIPLF